MTTCSDDLDHESGINLICSDERSIKIDLCHRCHVRFQSVSGSSPLYLLPYETLLSTLSSQYQIQPSAVLRPGSQTRCPACIGLLQTDQISDLISISDLEQISSPYSRPDSYSLAISIPPLCLFRDLCIRSRLNLHLYPCPIKDVLRAVLVPVIGSVLTNAEPATSASFRIDIDLNDAGLDAELGGILSPFISRTVPKGITAKQLRRTSFTSSKFVEKAVSVMSRDELNQIPIHIESVRAALPGRIAVFHDPVFLTGSYQKLCRRLSQTPWLIGDRDADRDADRQDSRTDGSVQELIAAPIVHRFGIDRQYKFHSAGREDIDVRMLGDGREFILEIIDPHHIPMMSLIPELERDINQSTDRVQVHSLSLTSDPSAHFIRLEQGAKTKTKSYRAIIWVSTDLTDSKCESVSRRDSFEIDQLTPIRVVHRRALLSRPRTIHSLIMTRINAHFAILDLVTQAGTYIKEFVHGDRGRTQPSIGSMLSCQADILQLDVLDLHHHS